MKCDGQLLLLLKWTLVYLNTPIYFVKLIVWLVSFECADAAVCNKKETNSIQVSNYMGEGGQVKVLSNKISLQFQMSIWTYMGIYQHSRYTTVDTSLAN